MSKLCVVVVGRCSWAFALIKGLQQSQFDNFNKKNKLSSLRIFPPDTQLNKVIVDLMISYVGGEALLYNLNRLQASMQFLALEDGQKQEQSSSASRILEKLGHNHEMIKVGETPFTQEYVKGW